MDGGHMDSRQGMRRIVTQNRRLNTFSDSGIEVLNGDRIGKERFGWRPRSYNPTPFQPPPSRGERKKSQGEGEIIFDNTEKVILGGEL